jgi:hypothetical protein
MAEELEPTAVEDSTMDNIKSAEAAIKTVEQKFDDIEKDNEELRSKMSEDELLALDKAKEILDNEASDDEESQGRAMREAAAVALVGDVVKQYNLTHKVSRAFLEMDEEHGLQNFLREHLKELRASKRKAPLKRKLSIEYKVLRNGHKQYQEGVTLQEMTRIFFEDFKPCQNDVEFKQKTKHVFEDLTKLSKKANLESILLSLRYCVKFPMNSLYGYFAMAMQKYCMKIGAFDSKHFLKSIIKSCSVLAMIAVATKSLPQEVINKMDLSILEEFSKAVEEFDKKLSEHISEKKEG